VGLLRRGVDHQRFARAARDREALERELGVPRGRTLVMSAGRLDPSKNAMVLPEAVRALVDEGWPIHLLCAGDGHFRPAIAAMLGEHVTCPGVLPPAQLELAYASADLFAQPSVIEELSNAVLEALAAGLPVVVDARSGSGRLFPVGEAGLVVDNPGPGAWAATLRALLRDPARCEAMGRRARAWAERTIPTWTDVLTQDLLPVWRRAAASAAAAAAG
jgi:glycosyltransferase involved in cell wall biosynthesis